MSGTISFEDAQKGAPSGTAATAAATNAATNASDQYTILDQTGQPIGLQRGNDPAGLPSGYTVGPRSVSFEDAAKPPPKDPRTTGLIANIGAGTSEQTANYVGLPVDLVTGALNLVPRGINAATGTHLPTIQNPVGGSEWWKTAQGYIGADPRTIVPADQTEQVGRAAGEGAAAMILPWGVARALPVLAGLPGAFQRAFSAGGAPSQAFVGGTAGAGGQIAANAVPEPYKPLAQFAGQLATGGLASVGTTLGGAAVNQIGTRAADYFAPLRNPITGSTAGQSRLAAQQIGRAATDLPEVRATLAENQPRGQPVLPPVPDGSVRLYHGGSDPTSGGARWVSPNYAYARDYRQGQPVSYVDVPLDHPAVQAATDHTAVADTGMKPPISSFNAPEDIAQQLKPVPQPGGRLVPDSQPTTFQLTGDQGLGNLERVVAKSNPDVFLGRMGEQNQARVAALSGLAPESASPDAIGGFFRGQLSDIDAAHTAQIDAARTAAREAVNQMGGAAPLTDANTASALQGFGQRLRAGLDAFNTAARARVSQLYKDVDPDGTLALGMAPIRQAANDIVAARPANAAPLSGDVAGIFQTARSLPDVQPFGEAAALRSRITDAMRAELYDNGRSQTYRTLTQLQKAIDNTLDGGVNQRAVAEDAAVKSGQIAPEQTILGRFKTGQGGGGSRQTIDAGAWRQVDPNEVFPPGRSFRMNQTTGKSEVFEPNAGVQAGRSDAALGAGQGAVPGTAGGVAGGLSGSRQAPGLPQGAGNNVPPGGLSGPGGGNRDLAAQTAALAQKWGLAPGRPTALEPNFDAAALARSRAANAEHAERVATYDEAPGVGAVLGTGRRAGEWRLGDSQVAATLFNSGKGAAERVQAFLKAGGSSQALVADLKDYAAFSLRHAAEEADGTLNPAKAERWLRAHDEALSAFPDLKAKFSNAATQRQMVDDAMARHVAAREAIEDSAARRFLGDADPVITMGRILRSDTADATMADLAQRTAANPAARAGLQRAVVDFIMQELRSNTVVGAERSLQPDKFLRFVQKSSGALGTIFSPEQVEAIQNVATDLQRSQRSVTGTKLPGGSNTPQDLAAGEQHGGGHPSTVGMLAAMEGLGEVGGEALGPWGKVLGIIGTPILNHMRQAGLSSVNNLVERAMMNPELARTLLEQFPTTEAAAQSLGQRIGRQLQAVALNSPLNPPQRQQLPPARPGLATPAAAPRVAARLTSRPVNQLSRSMGPR
jgi:hypothetical protein